MIFDFECPSVKATQIIFFGKGYGESILVNIGNNNYIVVDSFINPETKHPIVLDYLEDIGLNANAVMGIVCSHWDNDHIDGVSLLAKAVIVYHKIEVYVPLVPSGRERELMASILAANNNDGLNSTSEYIRLLNLSKESSGLVSIQYAKENTNLFSKALSDCGKDTSSMVSLAPSDEMIRQFISSLIIPQTGQPIKNIEFSNNSVSVILLLRKITDNALLGGDLENKNKAWDSISSKYSFYGKCRVFKIPHHGSPNAFSQSVWDNMMEKPISIITRFNPSRLPKDELLSIIKSLSSKVYVIGGKTIKDRDTSRLKGLSSYMRETIGFIDSKVGIVSLTWEDSSFSVQSFGAVEEYRIDPTC